MKNTFIILFMAMLFMGCSDFWDGQSKTDKSQAQATELMTSQANAVHGMPQLNKFTERGLFKNIYELRDDELTTFTYIIDMNGNAHYLCPSIGYGIPYSAQYVSPEKLINPDRERRIAMPQPEPNGLFMPTSSSATWVTCISGGERKVAYVEPEIIVTPFELRADPMR